MYIMYRRTNKKGEKCFEVRVVIGYDENKKQKRFTKIIHANSMQGAKKIARQMQREGKIPEDYAGSITDYIPSTFQEFAEHWKEEHYPFLAPRTQTGYSGILDNYILDFFASRPLQKIDTEDIRRFIRYLHASCTHQTRTGKLSDTMINKCFRLLSEILSVAEEKKWISRNPCKNLSEKEIPRADYRSAPIWQPEELKFFIHHLQEIEDTYHNFQKCVMFHMILLTGMRKGEASVLRWSDISIPRKSIQVNKALKLMNKQEIIIDTPKTKKSSREVFIDDSLLSHLSKLWNRQQDYLSQIGQKNLDNYIFITQRRESREVMPVSPSYLYLWLRKEAKECGLPHITVHSIRHMAATYALANGAPIMGVQNMMGHTSLRTTSIYLHATENQKQDAAKVLSDKLAALRGDKDD